MAIQSLRRTLMSHPSTAAIAAKADRAEWWCVSRLMGREIGVALSGGASPFPGATPAPCVAMPVISYTLMWTRRGLERCE